MRKKNKIPRYIVHYHSRQMNEEGGREGEEEVANRVVIVAIHKRAFQDVYILLVAGEFSSSFSKPPCRGRKGGREWQRAF